MSDPHLTIALLLDGKSEIHKKNYLFKEGGGREALFLTLEKKLSKICGHKARGGGKALVARPLKK